MGRVVVAMSGGVDSSVAAALLVEQGFEVIGIMLRLWSELAPGVDSSNRCCAPDAVDSARAVAYRLGIPFYLVNAEAQFRAAVVDHFIAQYAAGRTPNPCVVCNSRIRFGYLLDYARSLGVERLATGHYARVTRSAEGAAELRRGVDADKDQSYVLHGLTQEQLASVLFPLGSYTKAAVRALAAQRGLPSAGRTESMDLCFAADGDYRRFLRDWAPGSSMPGPIVNEHGDVLGSHRGLAFYTVGQRHGLRIAAARPLYVLQLRTADNALVVGDVERLAATSVTVRPAHWISGKAPAGPIRATVEVRYRSEPAAATVVPAGAGACVRFDAPVRCAAPGQSAVFYQDDLCLGGGVITGVTRTDEEADSGA